MAYGARQAFILDWDLGQLKAIGLLTVDIGASFIGSLYWSGHLVGDRN
jgi:hypothetical protein